MTKNVRLLFISLALLASPVAAAEFGALGGAVIAPIHAQVANLALNSPTTATFTAANTGWCARVMATDTRDFKSVAVNFSAATTPGTATIRIETVDAATGKPSGSLYDAAATKSFTPAAGWNVVTFDTLPTTGTTAGTQYAVVLLKDDAGTTCTLRSHIGNIDGNWPTNVLAAADGSTRSNFAETVNSTPVCYFVLDDNTVTSMGCVPVASSGSTFILSSASRSVAQKIVLPCDIVVRGVRFHDNTGMGRTGTPPADLRMRILDSTNTPVSGGTVTIDKDTLTNINARGLYVPLPPTTLVAGTYRVAFDSAGDGSNYFSVYYITLADSALQSSGFCYSESTNIDTTFTWTDTPTRMLSFGLELDSIPASGTNVIDPLTGTIPGL
jgi:hypothetical protein